MAFAAIASAACEQQLREAQRGDALAAASACGVKVEHFGHYYRLDGGDMPDNGIWFRPISDQDFGKKSDCLKSELRKRGVRAIIIGNEDQETY